MHLKSYTFVWPEERKTALYINKIYFGCYTYLKYIIIDLKLFVL